METRYIEEYKDSKLINKIPYEVSDEELIMEIENKELQILKDKAKNNTLMATDLLKAVKLLLLKK